MRVAFEEAYRKKWDLVHCVMRSHGRLKEKDKRQSHDQKKSND